MLVGAAARAQEPEEIDLFAKQRILPAIGPGLRAVRQGADGRLYILASPSPGLVVVDTKGKQLLSISEDPTATGNAAASHSLISFGDDCDVDAEGKIYVADRGANLIRVFSSNGNPLRSFPVKDPISVAVLPEEEVAVATLREPHLVIVYDKNGKEVREFGDPEPIAERADLNRFLNIGRRIGRATFITHLSTCPSRRCGSTTGSAMRVRISNIRRSTRCRRRSGCAKKSSGKSRRPRSRLSGGC